LALRTLVGTLLLGLGLAPLSAASAQDHKDRIAASLDAARQVYADVALQIWSLAEVGYQEEQSSGLLQAELRRAGFRVESGVAGMPTAFVATYGSGGPVIGMLAEYDALPGLSQDSVPERRARPHVHAGHACGHHLFGTASVAAAVEVRDWLARSGTPGTLRVYGTPAEEGGSGKVYMVRAGLFDDVDVVLHWHPGDGNDASPGTTLANTSGKFRFHGVSAHAAGSPERGRSALDGVEAMNHMVNMMREHTPDGTRIHYVITAGGAAPNVVPDFAEVYYYARHPDPAVVQDLWARIVRAAEGAAMGTETRVEHEITGGVYSTLPNHALAEVMDRNLRRVGGVAYTAGDLRFAAAIRPTLGDRAPPLEAAAEIRPLREKATPASTDVGDVSWVVPAAGLSTATWVPGTAAHSWQAVAAGGTNIGVSGMLNAAKTIAMTATDLFLDPALIARARAEFEERRGPGFRYRPLVGDRDPPLESRR
jgi:aminobenzoyl-glutamate utilization protein B